MNKSDMALVKIEQAFATITATFDQRTAKLIKSEERRIGLAIAERRRKRAAKRKELREKGEPMPKYLLTDDEKHPTKSLFEMPKYILEVVEEASSLSVVSELSEIKENIRSYCEFLKRLKDSDNATLHETAYDLYPKAQKLLSLIHIHRAHPDDAIKRANLIINSR